MNLIISSLYAITLIAQHVDVTAAAHLTFESSPAVIYPVVTKQLRLRCSVQSTSPATTVTTPTPMNTTNPGILVIINPQIQSTNDDGDVSHVMSIIIAKKDNTTGQSVNVASVTAYDQATAEGPFSGKVRVEGSSEQSHATSELGFLELIWDGPAEDQAGLYTCEIFGLNLDKHSTYLRTSKEVIMSEPDIASLVNFIIQHDTVIQQLESSNEMLRDEEARLQANLTANHEGLLREALKEAELMMSTVTSSQRELDTILEKVEHSLIQTGKEECNNATDITFRHYYNSTPAVLLSITDAEFNPNLVYWPYHEDFGFQVYVQTVDNYGFSAFCKRKGSNSFANFTWFAMDKNIF
ncbi:unnamed protein product [Lymnaea stagnalis]|uniref:Uncharacterized protein n=1 Tax=Lymnaea stagnalis TaxID=6523 RepID=A0AAV2IML2_LYMST